MSDLHSIDVENDTNLNFVYSPKQSGETPLEEDANLVLLNSNRAATAEFSPEVYSDTIENSDTMNMNESATDSKPKQQQQKKPSSRGKPSAALLQAKLNAKKLRNVPSPTAPAIIIKDHLQPARDAKDTQRKATGVVYDARMIEHQSLWDPTHPENPKRFTSIIQRCQELGLFERCQSIPSRFANPSEVTLLHAPEHVEKLQKICEIEDDVEKLEDYASQYDAIYFHPSTYELSLLSCGSTIDLIQNIVEDKIQNGMAIVRPPGHHAMKNAYCGYCYFNNVAIAAKKVLESSSSVKKILIVDWDVHHGQATQQMFYDDPRVLYFSTHRYEHGMYWPNLEESNFNWIGTNDGFGFNCNIPLNSIGLGNVDFLSVWHKILIPMAYQFCPDLVIISAGFDAALGCPEGCMKLMPQCYPHLLWPFLGMANGKVAVILEGGYCPKSLAEGAALTLRTLLGDPCPIIPPVSNPSNIIVETILNSTTMLKDHWSFGPMKYLDEEEFNKSFSGTHTPSYRFDWDEPTPPRYPTRDQFSYCFQSEELRLELDKELDRLILSTSLGKAKTRVGLVYDDVMLMHRNMNSGHPECPERISNIFACHVSYGLVERCLRIPSRKATTEELSLIHDEKHILKMKNSARLGSKDLSNLEERYNSIYLNSHSYECALHAAGSILNVVDSVMDGKCQSGVAIVRPPGHHAEVEDACGFCLFNNVALGAKYAIENHSLRRILIVDWDVHHGNGIQHMFENDPRVLYVSIHRYDHGSFFPGSPDANYNVVGHGRGEGFNVNIPWNKKGMGDTEYLAAFTNVILPIAYEYAPELVFVSAGFDAAQGDPLGGCKISPEGYAHMTHLLSSLANGKVIIALEGGYNLTSISYSMSLCTKALLGDPIPQLTLKSAADESAIESIRNVLETHSKYWTTLKPFLKALPSQCPVKPGKYTATDEVTELMEKLVMKDVDVSGDGLDQNANSPSDFLNSPISPVASIKNFPSLTSLGAVGGINYKTCDDNSQPPPNNNQSGSSNEEGAVGGNNEMGGAVGGSTANPGQFELTVVGNDGNAMFAVIPLNYCPHVTTISPVPQTGIDVHAPCDECRSATENWICLHCYSVKCSRYVREHMLQHSFETDHAMALSFSDLSVWCFPCESYVSCPELDNAKAAAYSSKFGEPYPLQ